MTITKATIAKISYRTNVGRTDAEVLSLGTLVSFRSDDSRVEHIVLLARNELAEDEIEKMDLVARKKLCNPAKFFREAIDAALLVTNKEHTDFFAYLSEKFKWSIYVAPAADVSVPEELAIAVSDCLNLLASENENLTAKILGKKQRVGQKNKRFMRFSGNAREHPLASVAGPELSNADIEAYMPPVWMINESSDVMPRH